MTRRLLPLALLACVAAASAQTGKIKSITLERTPCYGTCPAYKIILHADGTAEYVGERFAPRQGRYRGTFWVGEFDRLAPLLEKWGYWKLKPNYRVMATDQATQIVTVVTDRGKKTVIEYGQAGPTELWALQTLIDGLSANVKWEKGKVASARHRRPF